MRFKGVVLFDEFMLFYHHKEHEVARSGTKTHEG